MPSSRLAATTLAAAALLLAGCGSDHSDAAFPEPPRDPHAVGTLGPGFWTPSDPPAPEATLTPAAGSWDDVRPKAGYRVALVVDGVAGDYAQETSVLNGAVTAWARSVDAQVTEFTAPDPDHYVAQIQAAIDAEPDLVISVGNGLVDPMALVTASNLETQFLLVGSEIAEPTANVTAADWTGAMFRGEGLGLPETYDPASFTAERAGRAVRAGVAAVLTGHTGIVVQVG